MFNFFQRKADVLNHWIAFADGFQISPSEFYSALARELESRKVPQMQMSDVELAEGGLLSEKRVYLRMLRERLVFDVCAAPFGSGFFFSCRTAEIPLTVSLWQIVALATGFSLSAGLSLYIGVSMFGFFYGVFGWFMGWIAFLVSSIYLMRNAVAMGLKDLDKTLIQTPVVGVVYEAWFRRESYHRIDSRLCYLEIVPSLVKELAEKTVAVKGIELVRQYELSPVLGDLYKRTLPGSPRFSGKPSQSGVSSSESQE